MKAEGHGQSDIKTVTTVFIFQHSARFKLSHLSKLYIIVTFFDGGHHTLQEVGVKVT